MVWLDCAAAAEEHVRIVLSGWKSQYCYTLTPTKQPLTCTLDDSSATCPAAFDFSIEWSRRPSPHEPLPSIRVHMTATVLRDGGMTCRLESEEALHCCSLESSVSMDAHILRLLKAKAEFLKRNRLPLDVALAAALQSRLAYLQYNPTTHYAPAQHCDTHSALIAALIRSTHARQPFSGHSRTATTTHTTTPHATNTHRSRATTQRTMKRRGWDEEDEEEEARCGSDDKSQQQESVCEVDVVEAATEQQALTGAVGGGDAGDELRGEVSAQIISGQSSTDGAAVRSLSPPGSAISSLSVYSLPGAAALEGRLVELFRQADVDGRYTLEPHTAYPHLASQRLLMCRRVVDVSVVG